MPSIFQLEGPKLGCMACQAKPLASGAPSGLRWLHMGLALVLGATGYLVFDRARKGRPLFGPR